MPRAPQPAVDSATASPDSRAPDNDTSRGGLCLKCCVLTRQKAKNKAMCA